MRERIEKSIAAAKDALTTKNSKYKKVFLNNEEGEYVLAEIYKFAGLDRTSYVQGVPDATAYNEGMKRVALHIKGILKQSNTDIDKLINNYQESVNYDPFNK
jgi:hypothetical protein